MSGLPRTLVAKVFLGSESLNLSKEESSSVIKLDREELMNIARDLL